MIEPSVSVPSPAATRLAATDAPSRSWSRWCCGRARRGCGSARRAPLQPLVELLTRKLAHSERLVLPRITAPAARSRAATVESWSAGAPWRASEPAVVCILSPVSMLPLSITGMPCSGPRGPFCLRSRSSALAIRSASGLSCRTALTWGPLSSIAAIRSRYMLTRSTDDRPPRVIAACRPAMVASSICTAAWLSFGSSTAFAARSATDPATRPASGTPAPATAPRRRKSLRLTGFELFSSPRLDSSRSSGMTISFAVKTGWDLCKEPLKKR